MRWCNFHCASTIIHIDILVGDDRDFLVGDWQENSRTDEVFVTLVIWVNSHRYIAKHGFWSCGSNDNLANFIQRWVGDLP